MKEKSSKKLAILWVHFGPYHLARLRALRQRHEVTAIEFAAGQQLYNWSSVRNSEVLTLDDAAHENTRTWQTCIRLWRLLNAVAPDVLFIPGYREPLALVAALWGTMHSRTNVLMSDSTSFDAHRSRWREKLKGILIRRLYHKAFVSGRRSAQYLQSLGLGVLPLSDGYDVIDNDYFDRRVTEIRRRDQPSSDSSAFLYIGRLAPAKNLPLLLEAFGRYRNHGGMRILNIVGQGPLESQLKSLAAKSGQEQFVHFAGFHAYESLPEWYARAVCVILPSIHEPWGLVVNEAMASGLPVIVSDHCGCSDDLVQNGENGYIFPAQDSQALAEQMLAIDALSEARLQAMGRRSQEIIARYTPETWADAVLRLSEVTLACTAVA